MTVNSSASLNNLYNCSDSAVGFYILTFYIVTKFLLPLPLSLLVLYLGFQRWRQQRSFATTSHSDIFTYHFAAIELIFALGVVIYICGRASGFSEVMTVGYYCCSIVLPGETSCHILTCVERYLAVVHPVVYLRLRQSGGVRIRNISTVCVWLLCFGWIGLAVLYYPDTPHIPTVCFMFLSLVVISFCSLSILHVLSRAGPREMAANRVQVHQSKLRAFHTITAILGVLWFYILGYFVCLSLYNSNMLSFSGDCVVFLFSNFVILPSSLILPLLFLHRAGKLICCHSSNE